MSGRRVQATDRSIWITCEQCGEIVAQYDEPRADLDEMVGDAYSDHMHDEHDTDINDQR
jgi:hypothetical protein